jgi:hypothetical protein
LDAEGEITMNFRRLWDWIDDRQIDKHLVSMAVLYGTVKVTQWAMVFASAHPDSGMAIASVTAPYMGLQGAAIKFYFESRATQ